MRILRAPASRCFDMSLALPPVANPGRVVTSPLSASRTNSPDCLPDSSPWFLRQHVSALTTPVPPMT